MDILGLKLSGNENVQASISNFLTSPPAPLHPETSGGEGRSSFIHGTK